MDGMNDKGHYKKPVANSKPVGAQGNGGALKGQDVAGASNPKGIVPQKIGGGVQIVQGAVEPKVGK